MMKAHAQPSSRRHFRSRPVLDEQWPPVSADRVTLGWLLGYQQDYYGMALWLGASGRCVDRFCE